jgi:hypothetical protein
MNKLVLISALALAAACNSNSRAKPEPPALPELTRSLDPVRAEFNAHASEPRFLTLLSAT